jgi:hypothetical protein
MGAKAKENSCKGKTTTMPTKKSLSSFPLECVRQKENEKFHYTFILWHHEFILRLFLIALLLLLARELYGADVQGLFVSLAVTKQNNKTYQPYRERDTNLHVTIICV